MKQIQKQARANVKKTFSVLELLNKERSIVSSFVDYCFAQTKGMTQKEKREFIAEEVESLLTFQKKFDKQIKQTNTIKENKVVAKK